MTDNENQEWAIVFRPLKSDIPAAVRIRQLLKYALRGLDLRCEGLVPAKRVPRPGKTPDAAEGQPGA